jgi:hypothetical protein
MLPSEPTINILISLATRISHIHLKKVKDPSFDIVPDIRELYAFLYASLPEVEQEASITQGMTLKQRIEHVGGTFTKDDLVVFGSIMAVNALVGHVIRDIPPQPDHNVNAELLEALKNMVEMVEMNGFGKACVMDVAKRVIEKADRMGVE